MPLTLAALVLALVLVLNRVGVAHAAPYLVLGIALWAGVHRLEHALEPWVFVGKQLGIAAVCWICMRARIAALPSGAAWVQLYGVSLLCGIGFTMSLFIAALAFGESSELEAAKVGVLAGSLVSALTGAAVLARASTHERTRSRRG